MRKLKRWDILPHRVNEMAFESTLRVDFSMLDPAGVVYYPVYWDLAHRFFEESWIAITGTDYPMIINSRRLGFPVVKNEATFSAPFRYGETVHCKLWVESVGHSSTVWRYEFRGADAVRRWTAKVVTVCIDMGSFERVSLPDDIAEALRSCRED